MAIFSRRRGSTGQVQRPNAPVSSAAAVAANAAFLNKSPSAASLSSAAAAAALRSHTTSPEPIANLQTKRMVRRLSQSSNGSGSVVVGPGFGGGQRPIMRRSSQGSMTDRTFRSPSPGGISPRRAPVPAADDAPPVPALRLDGNSGEQHSRPSSRASATAPRPKPAPVKVYQPTGLPKVHELEREGSRNSVNFSRPIASPTESTPPVSPTRPKTAGSWFGAPAETKVAARQSVHDRPKSAVGISAGTKSGIEAGLQSVARTPSKKKQKAATQAQGSKLAADTLSKTPQGTAVSAPSTQAQAQTSSPTPLPKKRPATKAATAERTESDTDVSDADRRRQTDSPSGTRKSTHTLSKQPSVVMEEPDTEQDIIKQKRSQDSAYPKLDTAKQRSPQTQHLAPRSREPSLTPSTSSAGSPPMRSRPVSLEVPDHSHKSAHFSNKIIDTPTGVRHNPPPRSISPAKSALKHSPSSSIRTTSPVATFSPQTRPPGSDTSDSMSLTSQDGIKTTKRKKAARVSFDDSAIEHIHEREEKLLTNGVKNARRSLSPGLSDEDMDDETMKPRPALPSFGSVRNTTPRRNQPESPQKVTETLNDTTKQQDAQQGTSNDHAVAAILNDAHSKKAAHDVNAPLPPEVTSVEGTGHFSDSGESSDEEELIKVPKREQEVVTTAVQEPAQKRDGLVARDSTAQHMGVPDIQVLPATPGIEEVANELTQESSPQGENSTAKPDETAAKPTRVSVPGGWDEDEEEPVAEDISHLVVAPSKSAKEPNDTGEEQAESDSDDSAAFSDAAEDPSELEPFGYASLDAIVESPLPSRSKQKEQVASPAMSSPLFDSSPEVGTPTSDNNDWSRASAYWSNQKQQLQRRESDQPATEDEIPAQTLPAPQPKAVKPRTKPVVENPTETTSSKQPARQMRSSMREKQSRVVEERPSTFRKTMRGPPPGSSRPTPAERTKPAPPSALQQKTMRPASAGVLPSKPAPVTSKPSALISPGNDSDSESSFRKKPRRGSASDTSRYTMKRSMRSASLDRDQERRPSSSQGVAGAGRWSLRSMSPPGDTPQSNRSAFRTSLRGTSIPEGPTLRGSNSIAQGKQPKSGKFSMSGFSRGAKPAAATPTPAQTKKAFKSRFADSDSEDEAPVSAPSREPKQGFRSRYADSDDEDDQPRHIAADLTPLRGIPRPTNTIHEDSTDLDDSSDDEFSRRRRAKRDSGRTGAKPAVPSQADIDKAMAAARQNVAAMTGNQALLEPSTPKGKVQKRVTLQTDVQPPPSAPATPTITADAAPVARRKGLLGSIFSRRNSSSSVTSVSRPAATATDMTPPASPGSPRGKLQRRHAPKLSRNASVQSQLSTKSDMSTGTTGTATTIPAAPATPAMPAVKEDDEAELWPLEPPRMPAAEEERERPASSDGVAESGRAKLSEARPKLERRSVSGGEKIKPQVYSEKTGKKKRFGRLRRAFGLDD
ncbi:hypothetical protein KVT40_009123 [Elsinoe batatas]|uniref:Uncharacterized protein n=1 Tax=Elsinoe batatas TaxID=2601811 RepID=A0A8K0KV83_9PEZI|nr:hypothetical protein KVT40_009123 [Elsinoe batatas]